LGEIKDNKKKSKHKKTVDSNDEDSSLNMNNEDEDKEIEKELTTISLEDIKKIVLTRKFFEKYYFYPNFDEKVKGAFVRINLSSTGDLSQPEYTRGYSLDEIEEIVSDKIYDFAGNKCKKGIK
jgi:RNA polymerase-associated protein RTF1